DEKMSGVPLVETLSELKHRIQSPYILCVLDTSPESDTARSSITIHPKVLSDYSGVSILSANTPGTPSCDSAFSHTSYFAHYLSDSFKTQMGLMPLQAISHFVSQHVEEEVHENGGQEQHPILAIAPNTSDMAMIMPGLIVKSSVPARPFAIGHPV